MSKPATLAEVEAGRLAYNAYGQAVRFRNFQGDPMPDWGSLSDPIRNGWIQAAKAVVERVTRDMVKPGEHPTSNVQKF